MVMLGRDELLHPLDHVVGREIVGRQVEITGKARVLQAMDLLGMRSQCPIRSTLPHVSGFYSDVEEDQTIGVAAHLPEIAHAGMFLCHHAHLRKTARQQVIAQRAFAGRTRPDDDQVTVVIIIVHAERDRG